MKNLKFCIALSLFFFNFFLLSNTQESDRVCEYVYSDWGVCVNGTQSRSMICVCNGRGTQDLTWCLEQDVVVGALTQTCDSSKVVCKWRWTLWNDCSATCGGGNVTREQVCMCEGMKASSSDEFCDLSSRYGTEVAPCNTFACGRIPAHSKTYWMQRAEEGDWPLPDGVFNCSLGYSTNTTSPKGKRYSKILLSEDDFGHPQWLYLAKEWIAAKLNAANGAMFSEDILDVIDKSTGLIEKCDGWTGNNFFFGLSAKEKLGRSNNNIGGLEHVDEQVSKMARTDDDYKDEDSSNTGLYVAIPCIAIIVIGVIIGMTTYYIREKNNVIVDRGVFDSQDEESSEEPMTKNQGIKGDNLSPPIINLEQEKFDHSDSSEQL